MSDEIPTFRLKDVTDPLQETLPLLENDDADLDLGAITIACKQIIPLVSALGGAFSFAVSDLVTKVKQQEERIALGTTSVVAMLQEEKATKRSKSSGSGTRNLKRMFYMLWFVEQLVAQLGNGKELLEALRMAYGETMEKGHGWVMAKTVRAAFHLAPTTDAILQAAGSSRETCRCDSEEFSAVVMPHVIFLNNLYASHGLDGNW
jgi:hypothetical protein